MFKTVSWTQKTSIHSKSVLEVKFSSTAKRHVLPLNLIMIDAHSLPVYKLVWLQASALCSDQQTPQTCSGWDIQLAWSEWSPSYLNTWAAGHTAPCRTAADKQQLIPVYHWNKENKQKKNLPLQTDQILTMGFLNSLGLMQRTKNGWQTLRVLISSSRDRLNWLLRVGERFLVSAP